ncbi:MAG: DEAD/DEAH box helicase, partial [Candidatus Omnitrophica bacterium]|nr:DEAD/DEAH box helicase [Candidatus Omnitrophota bacterium]
GQIRLMDNMIEVLSSRNVLQVDSVERFPESIVLTLKEPSELTELKDASDVLLSVADKDFVFKSPMPLGTNKILLLFANGSRSAEFSKIPETELNKVKSVFIETNTNSEELQSETLQTIVEELKNSGSTGVECADYLLQLKAPEQDSFIGQPENITDCMLKYKFGLIYGGFGTIKTTELIEGVEQIILQNKSPVLVIAPQHPITDEITLRAGKKGMPVMRCGNVEGRFNASVQDMFARQSSKAWENFKKGYDRINENSEDNGFLLTATVMGGVFDWLIKMLNAPDSALSLKGLTVVVDEAALINYPELITAIYLLNPEALFLFGDHIQFKPYKISAQLSRKQRQELIEQFKLLINKNNTEIDRQMKACIDRYEYSFFEELMGSLKQNVFGLFKNFRNHWIIVELGQKWYEGVCEFESYSKENGDILEEDTLEIIDTSGWPGQLYEEKDLLTGSYMVLDEATLIVDKVKEFLQKKGKDGKLYIAEDITIITPYNRQIELIRELIDDDPVLKPEQKAILKQNVITSMRIQGGQNKVVLVSLGRSIKDEDLPGLSESTNNHANPFSFLFDEEKIVENPALTLVSITRAIEKTVIVGNRRTLEALTRESRDKRAREMYSWIFDFGIEIEKRLKIMRDADGSITSGKITDDEALISCAI